MVDITVLANMFTFLTGQYVYIFMYTANNKRGSVHTLQIAWNKVLEQSPVVYH